MIRQVTVVITLIAGVALIVLGATWKYWHPPQMLWSPEQATEYTDAWRALKAVATSGMRRADPNNDPKVAAAQARFDAINAKLEHAKILSSYAGMIFVAVGVILLAISIWLYSSRDTSEQSDGGRAAPQRR